MKNLFVLLLTCFAFTSFGQISFQTGSQQMDADLNSINNRASLNFSVFKADMSSDFNVSVNKIDFMKTSVKMAPGEIYFALEISRISGSSIDVIIDLYKKHKGKGWGYIAKQAGIKPGSPQFHQLKGNVGNQGSKSKGKSKAKKKGKRK